MIQENHFILETLNAAIGSDNWSCITKDDGFMNKSRRWNFTTRFRIEISGYHSSSTDLDNNIVFYTSGVEKVRLDSSGNLGIGTASPAVNYMLLEQEI